MPLAHGAGSKIIRCVTHGGLGWKINVLQFGFPTTAKGKPLTATDPIPAPRRESINMDLHHAKMRKQFHRIMILSARADADLLRKERMYEAAYKIDGRVFLLEEQWLATFPGEPVPQGKGEA